MNRSDKLREARIALTSLLPHVFLACDGTCPWCELVVMFDHAAAADKDSPGAQS